MGGQQGKLLGCFWQDESGQCHVGDIMSSKTAGKGHSGEIQKMYWWGYGCVWSICSAETWRSCHSCYITGDKDGRQENGKSIETMKDSKLPGFIQEGAGGGNLHWEQSHSSLLLFSFPWRKENMLEGLFCFIESWAFHLLYINQFTFCRVPTCSNISTSLITVLFWFLLLLHRSELPRGSNKWQRGEVYTASRCAW